MADTTLIEWTDATFNPWIGCTKVSPACDHCYAEALMDKRHGRVQWGGERSRTSVSNWQLPRRWQRQAEAFFASHGRRRRVFCASLADVFDNQVPPEWRTDLWALIRETPDLDWQLLTKRPQNIAKMLPAFWDDVKGHVWLGTTAEDQTRADQNIPHLLQHDVFVRFVSCEPLLGPIDLESAWLERRDIVGGWRSASLPGIDWIIAGGESGPGARPMHPDWVRSLRDQCTAADVPFHFKQWGHWKEGSDFASDAKVVLTDGRVLPHDRDRLREADRERSIVELHPTLMRDVGKKRAGRLLDGVEHNGFPEVTHG